MAKISINDECLAPNKYMYLTYSGPDPWGVANKITDTIKPFFHVSSAGTNNTRVNWDISGDPVTFYSLWWVKKEFSDFTKMFVYIKLVGSRSKKKNVGEFTLQLNSELQTEFSGWATALKPFFYMYSYLFYNRVRRKYIERCREMTIGFRNEIKEHFNLKVTEAPTPRSVMG